jgi:glutamyl-tRNA synthetase
LLTPAARAILAGLRADLATTEPWSVAATEETVRAFAEKTGVKLGAVAQPLRAALTGRVTSPGIFEVLTVLGRDESLGRLDDQAHGD